MPPRLLVYSSLFPSAAQPSAGIFVQERMFRVGTYLPVVVVAPQPWFPLDVLIRHFKRGYRVPALRFETREGIDIHRPRFFCLPGMFKRWDGHLMALGSYRTVKQLVNKHQINIIDAHFAYPDGYAASLLVRRLKLPLCITLRGKEARQAKGKFADLLIQAVCDANQVIAVSDALRDLGRAWGALNALTVGNGVDAERFRPLSRQTARDELGLSASAPVLISVGGLVERKGFHRVLACLPELVRRFPDLQYLIVGGASAEGDIEERLRQQAIDLGMQSHVCFTGPKKPSELSALYSAADVFVLATSYEGWANVFLEAMACGLPVVTTRVGGNAQVVATPELGTLVELGDEVALTDAIAQSLEHDWDRSAIRAYAEANSWNVRVKVLLEIFNNVAVARAPAR